MVILSGLVGLPFAAAEDAARKGSSTTAALVLGATLAASFGALIILVWLWVWRVEGRGFPTLGFERPAWLLKYLRGCLIGLFTFSASVALMAPFGFVDTEPSDPARVGLSALGGVVIVLLLGWLIQGAAEEILTRGWMLPVISVRHKPALGIAVSSFFFALIHGLNPNISLLALVNLLLYGVFAALYALREGSLWGICAFHSIWNWAQGNVYGLSVSGQDTGVGSVINLMETGPDWFTGGAFGPEGGLAVTVVLLLGCAIILKWRAHQPAVPAPPL